MTEELLDKAYNLNKKIKDYKKILEAFNAPYTNIIRLDDFGGGRYTGQIVLLSTEPELEKYVKEYFKNKLAVLEKEFAEMEK